MPTITPAHLHALLASADRDAALVIVAGQATVVTGTAAPPDAPEDTMIITTRHAVIAEFDTGANDEQLESLAQRLDVAFDSLSD